MFYPRDGIKACLKLLVQEGVTPLPQDCLSLTVTTNSYLGTCWEHGNIPGGEHLGPPKVSFALFFWMILIDIRLYNVMSRGKSVSRS